MGVMSMFGSPAIDRILAALQTAGGSLEQVVRELAARRADAVTARAALRAAPSPATLGTARAALEALRAAVRAVLEKYLAYHAIPYEEDGHEVGAAAEAAFERSR